MILQAMWKYVLSKPRPDSVPPEVPTTPDLGFPYNSQHVDNIMRRTARARARELIWAMEEARGGYGKGRTRNYNDLMDEAVDRIASTYYNEGQR